MSGGWMELIDSFGLGGSERLAGAIAEALRRRGREVSVCAVHGRGGPVRAQLEAAGVPCFSLRAHESSVPLRLWRLFRLLRRLRPRVLHVHHVPQLVTAFWPARLARVGALVLTEHASHSLRTRPDLNRLARRYAPRADRVTAVYQGLADYMVHDLGVPAARVRTIPNGVDVKRFSPGPSDARFRADLGIPPERFLVGCVGRLAEAKDHENLVAAILVATERLGADIAVVLAGDGPLRAQVEARIDACGLRGRFHLLGAREDVPEILRNLDAFVLPSRREGFPMAVLEAMSTGLACVATSVGGIPDVLVKGAGIVVPPESPEALAGALVDLSRRKGDLPEMGRRAREIVLERYTVEKVLDAYVRVLES